MQKIDFVDEYNKFVEYNFEQYDPDKAAEVSCGTNRAAFGYVERQALLAAGLRPTDVLVDVGCGYGRLAENLSDYIVTPGKLIGVDVVPRLIEYAREKNDNQNFSFHVGRGLELPVESNSADFISVFSVFTHMVHEDSVRYLREMSRALKAGGRILFTFLDFKERAHWPVFFEQVDPQGKKGIHQAAALHNPSIMFFDNNAIKAWCEYLNLEILWIHPAPEVKIPLERPVKLDNGEVWSEHGTLGQSMCLIRKPFE